MNVFRSQGADIYKIHCWRNSGANFNKNRLMGGAYSPWEWDLSKSKFLEVAHEDTDAVYTENFADSLHTGRLLHTSYGPVWKPDLSSTTAKLWCSGQYPEPPPKTGPITISARLYPDSELAAETGVVSGTVTNMLTGKGRFNLSYKGETYTGEATRVSNDSRRGVASAFSPKGGYMSCDYQMNTPRQGAGTCLFSNGAKYKLHLGD